MKKLTALALILALALAGHGLVFVAAAEAPPTEPASDAPADDEPIDDALSIRIQRAGAENPGYTGETLSHTEPPVQLEAVVTGAPEGEEPQVTWASSAPLVATVDDTGLLTRLAFGKSQISAAVTVEGQTCSTYVTMAYGGPVSLHIGGQPVYEASLPQDADPLRINVSSMDDAPAVWESSDTAVATVNSGGVIAPVAEGACVISAKCSIGGAEQSAYLDFRVTAPLNLGLYKGEQRCDTLLMSLNEGPHQLAAQSGSTLYEPHAWASSNPAVASVEGGLLTALSPGTTTITAQVTAYDNEFTASCELTVIGQPLIRVQRDGADIGSLSFTEGDGGVRLSAFVYGAPAGTSVSWFSSAPNVAKVGTSIATAGVVTPVRAGQATITAEIVADGVPYRAECLVMVGEKIVIQKDGADCPGQTFTLEGQNLTLQLGARIVGTAHLLAEITWLSSNTGVAGVQNSGLVYATGIQGTTEIKAKIAYPGYVLYSQPCFVTVSTEYTGIALEHSEYTLEVGDSFTLMSEAEPVHYSFPTWHNANPDIVWMQYQGRSVFITANRPGKATVTVSIPGTEYYAVCVVTVVAPQLKTLSLARRDVVLHTNGDPVDIELTGTDDGELLLHLLQLPNGNRRQDGRYIDAAELSADIVTVDGKRFLRVTPKSTAEFCEIRVYGPGGGYTSCRVKITKPPKAADYDQLRAVSGTVTLNVRSVYGARLEYIWSGGGPPSFWGLEPEALRFAGKDAKTRKAAATMNEKFLLSAIDDKTLSLEARERGAEQAASYRAYIAVLPPGGNTEQDGDWVLLKDAITVKVSTAQPKLAAKAVKLNGFWDDHAQSIAITGGEVARLAVNAAKTKPAVLTWLDTTRLAAGQTVALHKRDKAHSGTLYLDVYLKGWNDAEGAAPYTVGVKVSSAITPPATRLSATSVKLYDTGGNSALSAGVALSLQPKSAATSFIGLGFTGVSIPDAAQAAIYEVNGFNVRTGSFRLSVKEGKSPVKGKIQLAFTVGGNENTGQVVRHTLAVAPVKAGTRVKLKANKTSVTLNPKIPGDHFVFTLAPSIADFNLAAYSYAPVAVCSSKGKPLADACHPFEPVRISGGSLKIALKETVAPSLKNKTYQLKVLLPGVNAHAPAKSGDVDAALTLKVKVSKGATPSVTGSVKGKINVITGAKATLNLKFSGTARPFRENSIQVKFFFKSGEEVSPGWAATYFNYEQTGPASVSIGLNLEEIDSFFRFGTSSVYYVQASGGLDATGQRYTMKNKAAIRFTYSKLEATQDVKTVTLCGGNADSVDAFRVEVPFGYTMSKWQALVPGEGAVMMDPVQLTNHKSLFKIASPFADGRYVLHFAGPDAARKLKNGGTYTLKFNVYVTGCVNVVDTITLKVTVKKA